MASVLLDINTRSASGCRPDFLGGVSLRGGGSLLHDTESDVPLSSNSHICFPAVIFNNITRLKYLKLNLKIKLRN